MRIPIAQLKKLRGRSFRELHVRGQQELKKLSERWLRAETAEMSDAALLREIAPAVLAKSGAESSPKSNLISGPKSSMDAAAAAILRRLRNCAAASVDESAQGTFFPALSQRAGIVATMKSRFPAERQAIIERAQRACDGRFDLFDHQGLSFGQPINWHLDPISGRRSPLVHWSQIDPLDASCVGDAKIIWELNRHAHFITFGQAYWLTGDDRFVEAFIAQASSWMDANPPRLGINWSSSLELSFRSIAWLWALHLCAASPRLTTAFVTRLLKHLVAHGAYIESYLSRYFSPNTHLTGEALGLLYLGTALPELRRARAWRNLGLDILVEQLPVQVRDDGVYFEQSSYYHRYTADFYTHLLALARAGKGALSIACLSAEGGGVEGKLSGLFDHLMWITRPDGSSPLYGDDDGGRLIAFGQRPPNDFRDTLATGAALFGREDWKQVAGEAAVETLWLLGPAGLAAYDRLGSKAPCEQARAFDQSGFFVMRDGWTRESSYVLLDGGQHGAPVGCGHSHADALSLEFAAEGVNWLIDPGTFIYAADQQTRDLLRTTAAHNTVTVDGESQSVQAGPFAWSHIAECRTRMFFGGANCAYFEGWHDGYERLTDPVTHTRAVFFVQAGHSSGAPVHLIVQDRFDARTEHRYAVRYHFPAECSATATEHRMHAKQAGRELTISVFGKVSGSVSDSVEFNANVEQGWVSQGYGRRAAAPVAVFEAEGSGPQEFLTVIVPGTPEQAAAVEQAVTRQWREQGFNQFCQAILSGLSEERWGR